MDQAFTNSDVLAIVRGVITGIAAFLPWVTGGVQAGPVEVEAATTGIEGLGIITLLLGVFAILTPIVLDGNGRVAGGISVIGLIIVLVALWKFIDLGGAVSPGFGLYLTMLGGIGILLSGLWSHRFTVDHSTRGITR